MKIPVSLHRVSCSRPGRGLDFSQFLRALDLVLQKDLWKNGAGSEEVALASRDSDRFRPCSDSNHPALTARQEKKDAIQRDPLPCIRGRNQSPDSVYGLGEHARFSEAFRRCKPNHHLPELSSNMVSETIRSNRVKREIPPSGCKSC